MSQFYGTITGSSYGMTLVPQEGEKAPKPPAGLIVTQAVQTLEGWLGQVLVDKKIVWQSPPIDDSGAAIYTANARVIARIRQLFEESE